MCAHVTVHQVFSSIMTLLHDYWMLIKRVNFEFFFKLFFSSSKSSKQENLLAIVWNVCFINGSTTYFTDLSSNLATNLSTNRDTSSPLDLSPHSTNTKSASVRKFSEKNIIFLWTGRSFGKIRLATWTNLAKVNKFRDPSVELHEFVLPSREKHRFESLSQLIVRAAFLFFFSSCASQKTPSGSSKIFKTAQWERARGKTLFTRDLFIFLGESMGEKKNTRCMTRQLSWDSNDGKAGSGASANRELVESDAFWDIFLTFKIWSTRRMTVHLKCLRFWQEYLFTCVTS